MLSLDHRYIGIIVSVIIILIAVCLIVIKYRKSKKD